MRLVELSLDRRFDPQLVINCLINLLELIVMWLCYRSVFAANSNCHLGRIIKRIYLAAASGRHPRAVLAPASQQHLALLIAA